MISESLGFSAHKQWHIGEDRIHIKEHGWVLESGMPRTSSLEEQCEALLARIAARRVQVRELSRAATVTFSCVIYCEREPALWFAPRVVSEIAELGAAFDIDLYVSKGPHPDE
jgi:hypothetical protein